MTQRLSLLTGFLFLVLGQLANAQTISGVGELERSLSSEGPAALAVAARELGDPTRGAIVFHQPFMACTKCHEPGQANSLGPDLAKLDKTTTDEQLIESVLFPSKVIRDAYRSATVLTSDGKTIVGLLVGQNDEAVLLRDAANNGREVRIAVDDVEQFVINETSIMPAGQVNQLASRQQFLDLIRYLIELRDGGALRAAELKPSPAMLAVELPEYESHIDHVGLIRDWDRTSYERGEAIYNRLCINCHGTPEQPGSLPTSLRFATGKFKNGSDPYSMYQTLTRGFGLMIPQMWMVPSQKYDVIHYIREAYLKPHNPSQLFPVDSVYLASLPAGDTRGPKPTVIEPWVTMNYGPSLINTYEIGSDGENFAYKGIAVRLDDGPGGVSRGRQWMTFDHDTLRVAGAWSGTGFIDWNGIHFNGRHQVHPRIVGDVQFANATGPGWANPETGSFDDPRLRGRDGKPYGPLPRDWAQYRGLYHHGQQAIISYTVGSTEVLEMPGLATADAPSDVFTRTFSIGPRDRQMVLQVAQMPKRSSLQIIDASDDSAGLATFGIESTGTSNRQSFAFDAKTYLQVDGADDFDLTSHDFTIQARVKTREGGTILCQTTPGDKWVPDGKTLFIRGGRLCYDIGWVGVVQSRRPVNDNEWHQVAMTYRHEDGDVRLFVDGQLDGRGKLRPKQTIDGQVLRIGFTAPNFPNPQSYFVGELPEVRFFNRALDEDELAAWRNDPPTIGLIGRWLTSVQNENLVTDQSPSANHAEIVYGQSNRDNHLLGAGIVGDSSGLQWAATDGGDLRLSIPAGDKPLRFTLWLANVSERTEAESVAQTLAVDQPTRDLSSLTNGGPPRWPTLLATQPQIGNSDAAFAVDTLTEAASNPWLCQMRLTGFDFFADPNKAAICSWDGDVWLVTGVDKLSDGLTWQRIASGLFQPLGLKIVDEQVFVSCRDQIVILRDLNGDGETDFYENFNNDHQVTEHFHEFAMGLQTDEAGNFYYAKSARHALPAVVPHHGTLLRVSADGSKTEILATGFRAANGVCLNPDGTFIVTDQEGHWNPKNRINWVREGGFYGNMYGYHDVTDSSDDAMEQPLCWITNAFDRSPAELLWANNAAWGPLNGSLLNLSYGYGKIYVVPHEQIDGQMQGGMCELPIGQLPTGVMRGRFHPTNGQLYTCGMFAWGSNQQQPGGWYRIRYTGKPVHLPIGLNATKTGLRITFSGELNSQAASDVGRYAVKVWSLKRSANYGSQHYDEHPLAIQSARLSDDRRTVFLDIPDIAPTWCMEIRYAISSSDGSPVTGTIHNTIHKLGE